MRALAGARGLAVLALAAQAAIAAADVGQDPHGQGVLPFVGACFLGGLLSLLTPCVFPMIPVTVSYFVKQRSRPVQSAAVYALGIVSTFAVIGLGSALVFGATGISRFAASPWVNLVLGVVFVLLACNLLGMFEVAIPSRVTAKLHSSSGKGELIGPLAMGATFSLTSFTCTMPIVATLLASSSRGSIAYPALGLATYGAAFAMPFFLLALFPSWLAKLPRSGSWLSAVKPALGLIELAAAVKFFSNADLGWSLGLITKPVFLGLWVLVFGLLAAYLAGFPENIRTTGWTRRALALGSVGACGFLLAGLGGRSLGDVDAFMPPDPYPAAHKQAGFGGGVASSFEEAVALSHSSGKPIFIDFTGVTCTNCRWMEKNIFPAPGVLRELGNFVRVQLYTDRPTDADRANQALEQRLSGTAALPTYVLLGADGSVISKFEGATRDAGEFTSFLKKASPAG